MRVGVWAAPDVYAPTTGGAAVRALVLPQLFVAMPDGSWAPSLVEPGSDRVAGDSSSASFVLRKNAKWSDGSPIGAEDLRRSADARFVAGVDDADASGRVTVRFTKPLPGWRRLWSFTDVVGPPSAGIWGGPFVVAEATPGLETVLRRNDAWVGGRVANLDEVRLVLVPDATTARELLERGELDVLMPPANTVRTDQLRRISGVDVKSAPVAKAGGWSVNLVLNRDRIDAARRRALVGSFERRLFVGTLLRDEASVLDGFAGDDDTTWASSAVGDVSPLKSRTIELTTMLEEPLSGLVYRSMQKRVDAAGGVLENRATEVERVEGWLRDGSYDAAVVSTIDAPGICWRCRWEFVDAPLATSADAGDKAAALALETRLRDEALLLPLWRPKTVIASRSGIGGMSANPYALNAAWNAWEWWRDTP